MDKNRLRKKIFLRSCSLILILLFIIFARKTFSHRQDERSRIGEDLQTAQSLPDKPLALNSALQCPKRATGFSTIKKSGVITVITRNNPHCYYHYRGKWLGFEYELVKAFAQFLQVNLQVQVANNWDEMVSKMGQTRFLAANLSPSISRREVVDFSHGYLAVQQHIIIHKDNYDIQTISDLEGRTVHVQKGTSYEDSLRELQQEGVHFTIKTHEDLTTEELIQKVLRKDIEITVAHSHIAFLNRRYYPDIQIGFAIKETQPLAWAVPKGEQELLNQINLFFETIQEDGTFDKIFERYYADIENFDYVDIKKYHHRLKTLLPKYEDIIKVASHKYDFDWRLIAAQMYQESHFNPKACSFSGVRGLMQLTIPTAQQMGIDNRLDPEQSIMAGVKYLRKLYNLYDRAEEQNRILISLAAYNVGHGHILDAQEIARKMNLNPYKWSSLKKALPLLSDPQYYQQSRYGYCRGYEPIRYVQRIMTYYDILKRKTIEMADLNQNKNAPSEG